MFTDNTVWVVNSEDNLHSNLNVLEEKVEKKIMISVGKTKIMVIANCHKPHIIKL